MCEHKHSKNPLDVFDPPVVCAGIYILELISDQGECAGSAYR